jgi:intracellular multiplication protein IcmL
MASARSEELAKENAFHRHYYYHLIMLLATFIIVMLLLVGVILYQVFHRPPPQFTAANADGQTMGLTSYNEPNLLPKVLLTWASKAAVAAYTFDFANYNNETALARPYFTPTGWQAYQAGVGPVIQRVVKAKLFVNGVVSAPPVISNQGVLPGHGYSWRVQIPMLVSYQSAEETKTEKYIVSMTIVKVPTNINPKGIGIEQFEMS